MNRYDFVQVIDIDDNSHYYTVFASNYEQAFAIVNAQINEIKYADFRIDVYENVNLPILLNSYDCIIEYNDDFSVYKLQNSSHKEQLTINNNKILGLWFCLKEHLTITNDEFEILKLEIQKDNSVIPKEEFLQVCKDRGINEI